MFVGCNNIDERVEIGVEHGRSESEGELLDEHAQCNVVIATGEVANDGCEQAAMDEEAEEIGSGMGCGERGHGHLGGGAH